MEELIAQLLQQKALQTKMEADMKFQASMAALAPAPKSTMGPKGRGGPPAKQLPMPSQDARMPMGRPAGQPGKTTRITIEDGSFDDVMPQTPEFASMDDSLQDLQNRGSRFRGQTPDQRLGRQGTNGNRAVPVYPKSGAGVPEITAGDNMLGAERMNDFSTGPAAGVEDVTTVDSRVRDDMVNEFGWLASDFDDMSPHAAAALIADQLRTHRIRQQGVRAPEVLEANADRDPDGKKRTY